MTDRYADFKQEFHTILTGHTRQTERAAACFGLQQYPDAGAAIVGIATMIEAGWMMPDSSEPRLCADCGLWHIRGIERQ